MRLSKAEDDLPGYLRFAMPTSLGLKTSDIFPEVIAFSNLVTLCKMVSFHTLGFF